MKELLIDRSQDFFLVLERDKSNWPDFYFEYVKNAPYIFSKYHQIFGLDNQKISDHIRHFERRFVDKVFQNLSYLGPYKYEVARSFVSKSNELGLDPAGFHIYIVGALDIEPVIRIDENNMMIDVLSLFREGFENLEKLVFEKIRGR
ncbi:hypothetical protein [Athalassotoga saccharophila]|uniref:hypothetical protein n=1 Tax=Athalassotoga saccharophila TaxID=1441386 RepID=UPI00137B341B|nr:hypothetical protein [Athalassotoga saccharophila]BBJ28853.1 GAF sensor protein [Athalassotoga saccharophila]